MDAEEDWKSLKEGLTNGFEKVENEAEEEWEAVKDIAKEDWNAVKEAAKEDWELAKEGTKEDWEMAKEGTKEGWKTIKEETEKDWDKMDLDWNKRPLSDSEESNESHEVESIGERLNIQIISHQSWLFSLRVIMILLQTSKWSPRTTSMNLKRT